MTNSRNFDISDLKFPLLEQLSLEIGRPITIFDLETNGFIRSPKFGIVECAALTIMGGKGLVAYTELVHPEQPLDTGSSAIHGITESHYAKAPSWGKKWAPTFEKIAKDHLVLGYNNRVFDCPAVLHENSRYLHPLSQFSHVSDVMGWVKLLTGKRGGKLVAVCEDLQVYAKGPAHAALADVVMTAEVAEKILAKVPSSKIIETIEPVLFKHTPLDVEQISEWLFSYDTPLDLRMLSKAENKPYSDVTFAIGEAFDKGLLLENSISMNIPTLSVEEIQALADTAWGEGRSGNLKELQAVFSGAGYAIDYLELRALLMRAKRKWLRFNPFSG